MKKEIRKTAFLKSLPIMCSYLFVGMAYGMMMQEAGFGWYLSLAVSMTVYTGAFQFVLITLLSSGASFLTIGCIFREISMTVPNGRHAVPLQTA